MARYTKLYETLGFEGVVLESCQSIPQEDIKAQYRTMAKRWHPDKNENSPESVEMMGKLSHAWAVLGDPEKRAAYDSSGIGEEGLAPEANPLLGIELLQELIEALLYPPQKSDSLLGALMGGGKPQKPKLHDWSEKDFIKEATKACQSMKEEVNRNMVSFRKELNQLKAFATRLKWDPNKEVTPNDRAGTKQGKEFNPVQAIVNTRMASSERGLQVAEEKLLEIEACVDMLQYYTFDFDQPPTSAARERHSGGIVGKSATFTDFLIEDFEERVEHARRREMDREYIHPGSFEGASHSKRGKDGKGKF